MNTSKRLARMLVRGKISKEEYLELIRAYQDTRGVTMKTAEEIIVLLETELAEAYEMHEQARGKDAAQALAFLMKATTIEHLLDEIKQG